jgi:energy-coupling factor transport system permease protein
MPAQFDLYVRRNTWLHGLDPRVKFLFVVETTFLLFLWPGIWTAAGMIALCSFLLWQAQVPRDRVLQVWRTMAPLLGLVWLLTALFTQAGGAPVLLSLGPLVVTAGAVQLGLMLALRLFALALIAFLWLITTDQTAMVKGFVALGLPYTGGLTLALALRYLPLFSGLFDQVTAAQQARGLDFDHGRFWQRLRLYRPVLIAMIILALRQSEQLGWALEVRALGAPGVVRTTYRPLHFSRNDWIAGVFLLFMLVLVVVLRVV